MQWDTSDITPCPERVAAWNIEPIEFIKKKHTSILPQLKRARPTDPLCPAIPILVGDGQYSLSILYFGPQLLKKISLLRSPYLYCVSLVNEPSG